MLLAVACLLFSPAGWLISRDSLWEERFQSPSSLSTSAAQPQPSGDETRQFKIDGRGGEARYQRAVDLEKPVLDSPLDGAYVTLWLQQVHMWFKSDHDRVKNFLREAKEAGFDSIMTDVPWAWTEREAKGDIRYDTFAKDWVKHVCDAGLKLHIVLRAHELPPWLQGREDLMEHTDPEKPNPHPPCGPNEGVSMGSEEGMQHVTEFFEAAVKHFVSTFGDSVESFNPTLNNELEARFTQTFDCMRDFNPATLKKFAEWQHGRGFADIMAPGDRNRDCLPHTDAEGMRWWEFRNELLAATHSRFCGIVAASGKRCLLHIGEFLASSDRLNGNALNAYLDDPNITDFTMDSNMALWGAPSSPSVVGMMTDTARRKGKRIHYEAAMERLVPCDQDGEFSAGQDKYFNAVNMLYKEGIARGLESGMDALGFTNLCKPLAVKEFLGGRTFAEVRSAGNPNITATAILYVPYRLFAAYWQTVSAVCDSPPLGCWHKSFEQMPKFGHGKWVPTPCLQDEVQYHLLEVWDSLRLRHRRVDIVTDARLLTEARVAAALEIVRFGTQDVGWNFFEGVKEQEVFLSATRMRSVKDVIFKRIGSSSD